MPQRRIQKQPGEGGNKSDDFLPDKNELNTGPQWNTANPDYTPGQRSTGGGSGANSTLGNIDDVLNDNAGGAEDSPSGGGMSSGTPNSVARATKNQRVQDRTAEPLRTSSVRTPSSGRALSGAALGAAEKAGGGATDSEDAMRAGLYKKAGLNEEDAGMGGGKLAAKFKGISRRKKLGAAGGIGGIMGLLVAVALITPIYRIPAMLNDVENKVGAEVDHIAEKRAERIVVNYLIRKALGGSTTDYVITGSPLSDIWRTFQSQKLEKKIAAKTGITFAKGADGIVRIFHDGTDLGRVRNYDEVSRIIAKGTIDNRKDFKTIIKSVVPALRFHKASIEADSFKKRFKVPRFGAPKQVKEPAEGGKQAVEDVEKTVAALTEQQIDEGIAGSLGEFGDAVTCVMDGEACDTFKEQDPNAAVPDPNSESAQRDLANGSSKEVTDEINEASKEAKAEAVKDREGGFVARMLEKILTKVIGATAAKLATKAIPFVGWIDLAADLQHAVGNVFANDLPHRIPIMLKENAYGAIYTAWIGYADQQKAGRMPNSQSTALAKQAGGAEAALTYKYLYNKGQMNAGTTVKPQVGSNTYGEADNIINDVYNNLGVRIIVRGPLEAWYYTVGKLLKLVGDWGTQGVSWLMRITGFTALADSTLKEIFGDDWKAELGKFAVKAIMNLFGIAIDPLAKGAELFNNIFTGAAVALNYYCHFNLGCHAMTQLEGVTVGMQLQQDQADEMQMTSVKDRLLDTSSPHSLAGSLMRDAPSNPKADTVVSSLFGIAAKLPNSIAGAFSPRLRAADQDNIANITGVLGYGATEADLDADTAPEVRQQTGQTVSCPRTNPSTTFNACDADQTIIHSIQCISDPKCPGFANN